jgi:hypothetical protein
MQTRTRDLFLTVRTEGAILPSDLLERIAAGDPDLGGLTPEAYHLPDGEKITEATNRAWNRLLAAWSGFRSAIERLPDTDAGTTLTREKWLLPLFQELGYGRLLTVKAAEINGKSYAISHAWNRTPIHLLGCRIDLNTPSQRVAGASRSSPHSLLQEFLNRSQQHLWGIVSNGLRFRILRNSASLTRQSYVEFDLEAMMLGEGYSDFVLLWLLCHQSRVEAESPSDCWLERWSQSSRERGVRALEQLRTGVEEAIAFLGRGFLAYPANGVLRGRLRSGDLDAQDYYRQVLRLVYRLLFLFVAEDRGLLLLPGEEKEAARLRYVRYYSTARLRRLAERRTGTRHGDLYVALRLAMQKLGSDTGCPELALAALGSFLFSATAMPDIEQCDIANHDLLDAVRALAVTVADGALRSVDYKNLGAEELGSVYESLLELRPELNLDAPSFGLTTASGHERKTSGTYYTPTSLIDCLLDAALEPVLDEAVLKPDSEAAILKLKVVDPACGSGHFLIAAAHRIAKRLAVARTGDEEPSPEAIRKALRDVIGHCIYGVDVNPMAVELCKVNLWIEALDPGKPLSFLEHRIQAGNSLLGAVPALMDQGIPDAAFNPVEGDSTEACIKWRKVNKSERAAWQKKQGWLGFDAPLGWLMNYATGVAALDSVGDDAISGIREKERRYAEAVHSSDYLDGKFLADSWCAAFVWKKDSLTEFPISEQVYREIEKNPTAFYHNKQTMSNEVRRLARQYGFFHWHLAFPDVFRPTGTVEEAENRLAAGERGFDLVLGNPPWDTLSPDQREFFGKWVHGLRSMAPEDQRVEIERLLADANIAAQWADHCRTLFALVHFLKHSGVFTLFAPGNLGKGDFNIYRMFVETALRRVRVGGFAAQVVPAGLYGGANASAIRKFMFDENRFTVLVGCENKGSVFFPGVHPQTWFAIYAVQRGGRTEKFHVTFGVDSTEKAVRALSDAMELEADLTRQLALDTYAIPDLRNVSELTTSRKMYAACPAFGDKTLGKPVRRYSRELDMGSDRDLFTTDPAGLPVYEGRMISHFDHRAKTYQSGHGNSAMWIEREFGDPAKVVMPQWRVLRENIPSKLGDRCEHYRVGFGDVANPRNERSFIATLIPPGVICGHKVPTFTFDAGYEWAYLPWLAVANSFAMDWLARCRLSAPTLSYTLLDSLPFPRLRLSDAFVRAAAPTVLRLVCTSSEMTPFWNQMAQHGFVELVQNDSVPSSALTAPPARALARAELDAMVALHVFRLTRSELSALMDPFDVLRRREEKAFGEYRIKRVILEIYDAMTESERAGAPYQTRLDSPAVDSRAAYPSTAEVTERL